ncbi:hypothetical protein BST61_g7054 [Cercospora zeina]
MSGTQHGPPAVTPEGLILISLFRVWQRKNQDTAKYYAAAIAGLIGVFIIIHWSQKITRPSKSIGTVDSLAETDTPRSGVHWDQCRSHLSRSAGPGAAVGDPCEENTPLSPLAGYSYDSLNVLHRCSGYTVIIFMVLHVITYADGLAAAGHLEVLDMPLQHAGIVAGVAMICMLLTAIGPVRRRMYEAFYASHQLLAATTLVAVGLHRPEITLKALIITIVAAAIWFADKSLQLTRWLYRGRGNHCTLLPLPDGATRVTMHRSIKAQPGSHAFIWIPGVKLFQRHPFTLVSSDPATFVGKARDGFSSSLHEQAHRHPGSKFKASIEGPYGQTPDLHKYDKIVLVAGGSGAAFTIAQAMSWASTRRTPRDGQTLDFIWMVRHEEAFQWFEHELAALRANPRVVLTLFVTSSTRHHRREAREKGYESSLSQQSSSPASGDVEKGLPSWSTRSSDSILRAVTEYGRPDISAVLGKSMEGLVENDNVLIAACGPSGMLADLRKAAIDVQAIAAPMIDVHCEEFSY